jgi:hypothetical protein
MAPMAFPATHGGGDLLALRRGRAGGTEIVYDDGVTRRYVWRVTAATVSEARIVEALKRAAGALRILPALEAELKRRCIAVERVA